MSDDQHIEMMAANIAAGMLSYPQCSLTSEIVSYSLLVAGEIVRMNREPKP